MKYAGIPGKIPTPRSSKGYRQPLRASGHPVLIPKAAEGSGKLTTIRS